MGNSVHQQLAEAHGVKILTNVNVIKLEKCDKGMKVQTVLYDSCISNAHLFIQ